MAEFESPPEGVSAEDLHVCVSVLRQLSSDALATEPALESLRDAGKKLFQQLVLKERFGEADVVEYLKQKNGYLHMLKKLEKLQRQIDREHEMMRDQSKQAKINKEREERFAAIEASALSMGPGGGAKLLESRAVARQQVVTAGQDAEDAGAETLAVAAGVAAGEVVDELASGDAETDSKRPFLRQSPSHPHSAFVAALSF
jgi:hypothetical protein